MSKDGHIQRWANRVLQCAAGAGVLAGSRVDANGAPVKTYVKDLISVGTWRDPARGDTFDVTEADLDHWAREFARMKANGVKVPVPDGHTFDSASNRGYVEDVYRDGKTLFGKIDLIGEDAIAMASRTEVSIYSPASVIDGKGNKYDHPISHVALTPVPVISGQGSFVPIKLSRDATERVPAYRLAQEYPTMNPELLAVAKALGCDTSSAKSDKELHDLILSKHGAAKQDAEKAVAMSRERDDAVRNLSLARTEIDALKQGSKGETNPRILKLSRESRTAQLDSLNPHDLTALKPVIDEAKAIFVPASDDALALSLTPAADAMFDGFVRSLKKLDLKALGEQTRAAVALSRNAPSDGNGAPDPDRVRKNVDQMKSLAPVK